MALEYRGNMINQTNFRSIFSNKSQDILDEIELAILYDTQIGVYIDRCGEDWLKLSQIRKSIRSFIPKKYISTGLSANVIGKFRELYLDGYDLSYFDKYLTATKGVGSVSLLNDSKLYDILCTYQMNSNITKIDFRTVKTDIFEPIIKGIRQGYPMWIITDSDVDLDKQTVIVLTKTMSRGINIFPFLSGGWNSEQIALICANVEKSDINNLMELINPRFTVDQLSVIIHVVKCLDALKAICITDSDGDPLYNYYQMYELSLCVNHGIDISEIADPSISDKDMEDYFEKHKKEKEKKNKN